jgi:hypothetical protein
MMTLSGRRKMRRKRNRGSYGSLPTHKKFAQRFKFLSAQRFCQYISPIVMHVNFYNLDVSKSNLIPEVMPFNGYVFCSLFARVAICQHSTRSIVFVCASCGKCWHSSGAVFIRKWYLYHTVLVNFF